MRTARWAVVLAAVCVATAEGGLGSARSSAAAQASYTPEQLMKEFGAAVVVVEAVTGVRRVSQGTGFTVTSDGYIVTNWHVVAGAPRVVVTLADGRVYADAAVVASNAEQDVAVIKVDARALAVAKLSRRDDVNVGERIVTIGNPEGLERTISDGLLSGVRRLGPDRRLYQITAPISHGSSGSPVFDMRGEVIGVASAYLAEAQNLNFAVPVEYVRPLIASATPLEGKGRVTVGTGAPEPAGGRRGERQAEVGPEYAMKLVQEARSDSWGPCMNAWASSQTNTEVVESMVKDIGSGEPLKVLGWRAKRTGAGFIVSYTYIPSGLGVRGWFWEVDCVSWSIRPVHADYVLMKRYRLEMPADSKRHLVHAIVGCFRLNGVEVPKLTGETEADLERLWRVDDGVSSDYSLDCVSARGVAPVSRRATKHK